MEIKICGITTKEEIQVLNALPVTMMGMVLFFPKSKRNVSIEQAKELLPLIDQRIKTTAVVVAPTLEQAKQIEEAGFDQIQIHGELLPSIIEETHLPILKAFNGSELTTYEQYLGQERIIGFVFDASEPGSGKTMDWTMVSELDTKGKMRIIAGGLHPGNVQDAIKIGRPDGVDVSSGVEYQDKLGKDPEKIKAFVRNAKMNA